MVSGYNPLQTEIDRHPTSANLPGSPQKKPGGPDGCVPAYLARPWDEALCSRWAVLRRSGRAALELGKECAAWMLFFFVVGCRQKRMKMWFGNQLQTTAALLGGLHSKHVCAGDTADHWPHPTHHPLGIFRIHKKANGKRFLFIFFFWGVIYCEYLF